MLTLVDLALTGALLLIVIFSGYENFVSRIDHTTTATGPSWMASIDFTALKIKLLGSIVAISAIQLLKQFMAVKTTSDRDLMWYVVHPHRVRGVERAARLVGPPQRRHKAGGKDKRRRATPADKANTA